MKENNKLQCPDCLSFDVCDSGDRVGEAQDCVAGKVIDESITPIYSCKSCDNYFVLVSYPVCPKCNSKNLRRVGPFARLKREGESVSRAPSELTFACWDCDENWIEKI